MDRLLVVGASLAGLRAAQAARAAGFTGELTVVGDEPHLPYTRPPLSKELLKGEQVAERCLLPSQTLEVRWRLGVAATYLDRARCRVTLADGQELPYDRLILATGCRARTWPGLDGARVLRTLDDAAALKAELGPGRRLVIVGAGFIGCEVAASARALGAEVTMLDIAPHPLLPLGPELGARVATMHAEHGVELRCGTGIEALDGLDADVVVLALGAVPNTEWLSGSGLELEATGGVACGASLTTLADPDILAAGDIAAWPHPLGDGALVRIEHWTTAAEHGQLAGRNVLLDPSERAAHVAPPYFWSDQYDTKIQSVGLTGLADQLEIVEDDGRRVVAEATREGRLVGAIAFNAAKRLSEYRRRLAVEPLRGSIGETAGAVSRRGTAARFHWRNGWRRFCGRGHVMTGRALFLQHGDWGPPALLGEWAQERGIAYDVHRVDLDPDGIPALDGQTFICTLGSDHNPNDRHVPSVVAELSYIGEAVKRGVPVLGLCYGGQLLASVLGAAIERAPEPELGWVEIESDDPELVPEGPWLQWHYDRFSLPPGARELARSQRALQAFTHGPHLGVQFHPESTIEIVKEWARLDGVQDGEALIDAGAGHATRARENAFVLFDAFWKQRERGKS